MLPALQVFKKRMIKCCSGVTRAALIPLQGKAVTEQPPISQFSVSTSPPGQCRRKVSHGSEPPHSTCL